MKTEQTSSGINTAGLLLVAFIVLKLANVIDWKWIWVLSPIWIGLVIAIIMFVALFVLTKYFS